MFIGIDIGTYEAKGVVLSGSGDVVVAAARRRHQMSIPQPGYAEHDAEEVWWAGLVALVRSLLDHPDVDPAAVDAVGCSGIGPCVLPLDAEYRVLRPAILYGVDTRATLQCNRLTEELGADEILRRCGAALTSQAAGPKVLWIREQEPEVYAKTRLFATCQSYLVGRLTDEWVMDHSTAGYYGPCYSLEAFGWDPSWNARVGGTGKLPDLRWSTDVVGAVTPSAAAQTGLPVGVPVIAGTADAPAAAIAAGVVRQGDLMIMYGSSIFMIEPVDELVLDARLWSAPFVFESSYLVAGGISTAGTATRWWLDVLGRSGQGNEDEVFAELVAEAAAVAPGADGLVVLPHFSGERTPLHDPSARGVIAGLDLTHGRGHLFRGILEGIATGIRWNVDVLDELGLRPERVRAIGGGTRNPVWSQAVSDTLGIEQEIRHTGAAHGAALLAGIGVGALDRKGLGGPGTAPSIVKPREDIAAVYDELSSRARRLYHAVRNIG